VIASIAAVLRQFYEKLDTEARVLEERDPRFGCPSPCCTCCVANTFVVTGLEFTYICLWAREHLDDATRASVVSVARNQVRDWTVEDALRVEMGLAEDPDATPRHPCPLLLDQLCRVYPVRPSTCRLFGRSRYASGTLNVCDVIAAHTARPEQQAPLPVVEERSRTLATMLAESLTEEALEAIGPLTGVGTIPHFIAASEFDPNGVASACVALTV